MEWDILNIIAIVAFAFSGAIVALEEKYDIFGVYVLGLAASFGGGIIRNVLIGVPVIPLWEQGFLLKTALFAITIIYLLPKRWLKSWNRWNDFFDAIGLGAFTIQGALYGIALQLPPGGIILCSVATGAGGGLLRDILARRRPMILHQGIYALWALLAGLLLGFGFIQSNNPVQLYLLFLVIILLRIFSIIYQWHLRIRNLENTTSLPIVQDSIKKAEY
ncbi:trimeric intracellular cation channel family protein [Desulforamulus ferrireducens]|uniref:Glycine transporter domain-containing protein n=1 Tax=Desulforamulus ferrireducens TaxID=1833852 RepID=A0A1S6IVX4_9FIRM|nr:trimeric intracellular cation channel family protein [Desulforamulus ferrireducens]AQS58913.1 hypothetical protein B0537_07335 [Desulforamulus ferrireducens]